MCFGELHMSVCTKLTNLHVMGPRACLSFRNDFGQVGSTPVHTHETSGSGLNRIGFLFLRQYCDQESESSNSESSQTEAESEFKSNLFNHSLGQPGP